MDLDRLSICSVALAGALLVGCSTAKDELRTPGQSTSFIVNVARGGKISDWRLVSGASSDAARTWSEREAIHDLGTGLRLEGTAWACEFAENSIRLRTALGPFSTGDQRSLVETAEGLGAKRERVNALLSDVLKLSVADLSKARAAVCP
jgi:hypothetical protein